MNKVFNFITLTLTLVLIGIFTTGSSVFSAESNNRQSAVVTAGDWPPWEVMNDKEEVTGGISIELIKEMLKRMNIEMTIRSVPFKRALAELKTGQSDFVMMVTSSPERAEFIALTDPIRFDYERLCYSTERFPTFEWKEWKDLTPYTIATVRGYFYGDDWHQAAKTYQYKVSEFSTDAENARLLFHKRYDFMITLESTISDIFKEFPKAEGIIKYASKPIREVPLCFGLSKKSPLISRLPEMNETISQMRKDGTLKRILKDFYQEME